jgi:hypothetical protein
MQALCRRVSNLQQSQEVDKHATIFFGTWTRQAYMLTAAARAQCTQAFPSGATGLQCQNFGATPPCAAGDGMFFHQQFTGLNQKVFVAGITNPSTVP